MAGKKAKRAPVSPNKGSKQSIRPSISVKVNESARIELPKERGKPESLEKGKKQETPIRPTTGDLHPEVQAPTEKEARGQEPESNLKYALIGAFIVVAFIVGTIFLKLSPTNPIDSKFPMLTGSIMVCDNNNAICFLENGSWYGPGYTIGTDLSAANNFHISNETVKGINSFFNRPKINMAFGSAEGLDPNNAQLITSASPFSYYLGVYYAYIGQNKTISPYILKEYNSSEPALIILGPGTGANETSLVFDGKNVVVQGETYEDLQLVLGKLLIVVIRGN
jgi:hypothetical protein